MAGYQHEISFSALEGEPADVLQNSLGCTTFGLPLVTQDAKDDENHPRMQLLSIQEHHCQLYPGNVLEAMLCCRWELRAPREPPKMI